MPARIALLVDWSVSEDDMFQSLDSNRSDLLALARCLADPGRGAFDRVDVLLDQHPDIVQEQFRRTLMEEGSAGFLYLHEVGRFCFAADREAERGEEEPEHALLANGAATAVAESCRLHPNRGVLWVQDCTRTSPPSEWEVERSYRRWKRSRSLGVLVDPLHRTRSATPRSRLPDGRMATITTAIVEAVEGRAAVEHDGSGLRVAELQRHLRGALPALGSDLAERVARRPFSSALVGPAAPDLHPAELPIRVTAPTEYAHEPILLVEDNEDNRLVYTTILRHYGRRVLVADNGEDAVRVAREADPALIFMDISIPIFDGWEATRILKGEEATKDIPIIPLTAHALASDRERAYEAGCEDYLAKPCDPRRLVEVAKVYLGDAFDPAPHWVSPSAYTVLVGP